MKIIITCVLLTLLILFFAFQKNKKSKLRVINVLETTIIRDSLNRIENDTLGFNIAYFKDFEIFEYPIIKLASDTPRVIDDILTVISRVSKDTLFNYYVTKAGSEKVWMYESLESKTQTIIRRDSLLKLFNVNPLNLGYLDLNLEQTHKKISSQKANNIKAEYFIDDHPKDETYADTIIRYYDTKFNDISFSYSPRLDKEKQSKLVLTRFITLPRKVMHNNGEEEITPYMEDSSIIRETKTKRSDIYMALIKRFEKDSKNSK
jgi:hypothetical protein